MYANLWIQSSNTEVAIVPVVVMYALRFVDWPVSCEEVIPEAVTLLKF